MITSFLNSISRWKPFTTFALQVKTTFFNFSRTPIIINSRKTAVCWFRGFAVGTCSCSSYSDRECLTISVLCSQITDIVSYRRTLRAWYMAAWDTFIGQDQLPEVSSRKVPMPVLFYLYAPAGFPIVEGYNNGRKISVTSWSRTSTITIIIHILPKLLIRITWYFIDGMDHKLHHDRNT